MLGKKTFSADADVSQTVTLSTSEQSCNSGVEIISGAWLPRLKAHVRPRHVWLSFDKRRSAASAGSWARTREHPVDPTVRSLGSGVDDDIDDTVRATCSDVTKFFIDNL
jgi:hypothetical protein